VNIAVHFIRARNSLILSCSSEGFPTYIRYSMGRGEEQGRGKRGGKESLEL